MKNKSTPLVDEHLKSLQGMHKVKGKNGKVFRRQWLAFYFEACLGSWNDGVFAGGKCFYFIPTEQIKTNYNTNQFFLTKLCPVL
jgi:hypothetical protein